MKNFRLGVFFFLISLLFIVSLLNYESLFKSLKYLFELIELTKGENIIIFYLLIILFNFLYFLTPLPVIFIILFNGFILGSFGFYLSMIFVTIGSILIFIFSKKILKKNILKAKVFQDLRSKAKKFKIIRKTNNSIIFISRYIIPYFFHNIIFGLYELRLIRFFFVIFLAEIPMILALNNIGKSLNIFILENDYKFYYLFLNIHFLISFIFVFSVILIVSSVEKGIVRKK